MTHSLSGVVLSPEGTTLSGIAVSNGEHLVRTDDDGRFILNIDPAIHSFVFVTRRNIRQKHGWYAPVSDTEIKLELTPEDDDLKSSLELCMGHITDLHFDVQPEGRISREILAHDLAAVHATKPNLTFIVATGDLTNYGDLSSLRTLRTLLDNSPVPVIPLFGAHDASEEMKKTGSRAPWIRHWQRAMGPTHFSVNTGDWHLIVCPDEKGHFGEKLWAARQRWLKADLANAARKRIILAQHGAPTNDWLEYLALHGVELVLFGHWHASKCYEHAGILALSTPPFSFAGFDNLPRGFRIITLGNNLSTSYAIIHENRPAHPHRNGSSLNINWRRSVTTPFNRTRPLVSGSSVYIPLQDQDHKEHAGVLCLDSSTGEQKWRHTCRHSIPGPLALADGIIFAVTHTGQVLAMESGTGSTIWTRKLDGFPERWLYSGASTTGQSIIAGTAEGGMESFDIHTGQAQWNWIYAERGTRPRDWLPLSCSPIVFDDTIAIAVFGHGLSCLDPGTGQSQWHYPASWIFPNAPIIRWGDNVLLAENGRIHAINPVTRQHLWIRKHGVGSIVSLACDNQIMACNTDAGCAFGMRLDSGDILWTHKYEQNLVDMIFLSAAKGQVAFSALAGPLVTPRAVYLGGLDGYLRTLDPDTGTLLSIRDLEEPITSVSTLDSKALLLTTFSGSIVSISRSLHP